MTSSNTDDTSRVTELVPVGDNRKIEYFFASDARSVKFIYFMQFVRSILIIDEFRKKAMLSFEIWQPIIIIEIFQQKLLNYDLSNFLHWSVSFDQSLEFIFFHDSGFYSDISFIWYFTIGTNWSKKNFKGWLKNKPVQYLE